MDILLLESEPKIAELVRILLISDDHNVKHVTTLEDGLAELDERYKLVVTEWMVCNKKGEHVNSEELIRQADGLGIPTTIFSSSIKAKEETQELVEQTFTVKFVERNLPNFEKVYHGRERQ